MVKEIRTPLEGGASNDNEEAKKARERLPNMPSPTTNQTGEHAPSFIGEMQPSVVWAQSTLFQDLAFRLECPLFWTILARRPSPTNFLQHRCLWPFSWRSCAYSFPVHILKLMYHIFLAKTMT